MKGAVKCQYTTDNRKYCGRTDEEGLRAVGLYIGLLILN
jgi:hypothetical protein